MNPKAQITVSLCIAAPNSVDFDVAIMAILDLVWGSSDKLLRFCRSSNAVVSVHLSPHAGPDVIVFAIDDPITIKRLAFLESKLHFHLDRM